MELGEFQAWLDRRTEGFEAHDLGALSELVHVPISLTTRTAVLVIETREKHQVGLRQWADMLRAQRATMVCRAVRVENLGDGMASGTAHTEILSGAMRVVPPYREIFTFRLFDGVWKTTAITSGLNNTSWPIVVPKVDPETDGQTLEWTDARRPKGENDG